jgi:hypothetical protein
VCSKTYPHSSGESGKSIGSDIVAIGGRSGNYNVDIVENAKRIFNDEIFQYVKIPKEFKWLSIKEANYIYENMIRTMGVKYSYIEEKDLSRALCIDKRGLDPIEAIGKATYNTAVLDNKYSIYFAATIFITLCNENHIHTNIKTEALINTLFKVKYKSLEYNTFIDIISGKPMSRGMAAGGWQHV